MDSKRKLSESQFVVEYPHVHDIEIQFLQKTKNPLHDGHESSKNHLISNSEFVNFEVSSVASSGFSQIQINSEQNNENVGREKTGVVQSCFGHPLWIVLSLLLTSIFLIIPTSEFFLFMVVKTELCWLAFVTFGVMEILYASLPDAAFSTYFWSYVASLCCPLIVLVINGYFGRNNPPSLNFDYYTVYISTTMYFPYIFYGIDVYFKPISSSSFEDLSVPSSILKESMFIDAFTAANLDGDDIIGINPEIAIEDSSTYKSNWLVWVKHKRNISSLTSASVVACPSEKSYPSSVTTAAPIAAPHPIKNSLISSTATASCQPNDDNRLEQDSTRPHRVSTCYYFRSCCIAVQTCLPRKWFRDVLGYNECFLVPETDRRLQLLRTLMFFILINCFWYFLFYFTRYYLTNLASDGSKKGFAFSTANVFSSQNQDLFFYFLVYIFVNTIIRIYLKRVGMDIDKNKVGSFSLFFLGEIIGLVYYYTFYRLVFENVTNIAQFLELQFLHLGSEWILYPVRATKMFHSLSLRIAENRSACVRFISIIFPVFNTQGLSYFDWQQFIALDYGIRVFVILLTGLGISLFLLEVSYVESIRGVYSSAIVPNTNSVSVVVLLILAAVILEIINAAIMNYVFFQRRNLAIYSKLKCCFKDVRFVVVATVVSAFLFTNPFVASINIDVAKFVF